MVCSSAEGPPSPYRLRRLCGVERAAEVYQAHVQYLHAACAHPAVAALRAHQQVLPAVRIPVGCAKT